MKVRKVLHLLGIEAAEVNVAFVSRKKMKELNAKFRGIEKETDVLSFPDGDINPETNKKFLGDIIICKSVAKEQARKVGNSFDDEILFLKVHGLLHLLGYDHETDDDAKIMFALQKKIIYNLHVGT
ncbi:MAG: rRNA maturation RNase YbeY [Christensenellaceae bacterium]|jgi:probable rRNA maturation factor|nr:rRNA maturation RNase YbeY [Christensenellaceae bacterium]